MKNAIELENVYFSFDGVDVLENVSLKIKHGELLVFFGPNGGGKTTLLKLILGLFSPREGEVKVFGNSATKKSHLIGYVPQNIYIKRDFPISVLELVLLGDVKKSKIFGTYPKEIKSKAINLIKKVGLIDFFNKPFCQLSGGEMQRALIAKALLADPRILVLDEPTSNIDIRSQRKIFDLILEYKTKKTILMVTHNLEIILKHVKNFVLVDKKIQTKLPKEVCEHFALGLYHKPMGKSHE